MESSRYQQAADEVGLSVIESQKEEEIMRQAHEKEEARKQKKEQKRQKLLLSDTYRAMEWVKKVFDTYYLDALIGLIPGIGDIITIVVALPFINFSLFKVKSLPLTLAVLNNYMIDMILGMIPYFVGNIIDFFYKAHRKNLDMIVGYIEDKQEIIDEVNRKAVWSAILLIILIVVFVLMIKLVIGVVGWIGRLFS